MNLTEALQECLNSRYAFGLAIPEDRLYLSWGNPIDVRSARAASELKLNVKQFFPSKPSPDFPAAAGLSLEKSASFPWNSSYEGGGVIFGKKTNQNPNQDEWNAFCKKIDTGIKEKVFSKIVPSRSEQWTLTNDDPLSILKNLFSKKDQKTYRFFLWWEGSLFFGASPELLLQKKNQEFFIPCIAGTLTFDPNNPPSEADRLRFFSDDKEQREHQAVVTGVLETLTSFGISIPEKPDCSLLELRGLLHLFTPLRFQSSTASASELVNALHPTPAVGGYPQKSSLEFLMENEPWSRGLFASPMSFQIGENIYVVVAIRSGLYQKGCLSFFAGAGYVESSTPEKEWQETEKKMLFLKNILELHNAE